MLKTKKTICTSCMACYAACPVEAINIITDEKGFYAPVVDEKNAFIVEFVIVFAQCF